jgi:phosphoribosyl-ATP pyrophosphohydrolase
VNESDVLDRVYEVIRRRKAERPAGSYVTQLFDGGPDVIAAKLREECEELLEAATSGGPEQIAHEAADLLFHVWVLLGACDVAPARVYETLQKRFGTSGLAEKASRGNS